MTGVCGVLTDNMGLGCGAAYTQGPCPSAGLIGCCIISQQGNLSSADCVYDASQHPQQSECVQGGGTWTTTAL
jgi:hypothetical protein